MVIYIFKTAILITVFIIAAGIIDKIISVRMSGKRIPRIKSLFIEESGIVQNKINIKVMITLAPFLLAAFSIPSHNAFMLFNNPCLNILLLFLTFPFGYGYLIYRHSNKIQTRKFNIVVISYFVNLFTFFIIYLIMMDMTGIKDINGFIFLQQGGAGMWGMYRNPFMFSAALISLYASSGFAPFSGITKESVPNLNNSDENSDRLLSTLGYLSKYAFFVFFTDMFLGGAANIFTMSAKLLFLNSLFTCISMLFPKIGMKNTIIFNIFLLSVVIIFRIISGVI